MPITNTVLTKVQYEYLAQNITDQVSAVEEVSDLAQSGLHYIVLLQVDAPEVDLVNPFFDQVGRMDGLNNTSNWVQAVAALNLHAVNRGTSTNGTLTERLNEYLTTNSILVSQTFADLSEQAGFVIDGSHISP